MQQLQFDNPVFENVDCIKYLPLARKIMKKNLKNCINYKPLSVEQAKKISKPIGKVESIWKLKVFKPTIKRFCFSVINGIHSVETRKKG